MFSDHSIHVYSVHSVYRRLQHIKVLILSKHKFKSASESLEMISAVTHVIVKWITWSDFCSYSRYRQVTFAGIRFCFSPPLIPSQEHCYSCSSRCSGLVPVRCSDYEAYLPYYGGPVRSSDTNGASHLTCCAARISC